MSSNYRLKIAPAAALKAGLTTEEFLRILSCSLSLAVAFCSSVVPGGRSFLEPKRQDCIHDVLFAALSVIKK